MIKSFSSDRGKITVDLHPWIPMRNLDLMDGDEYWELDKWLDYNDVPWEYESLLWYRITIDFKADSSTELVRFSKRTDETINCWIHPHISTSWSHCRWNYWELLSYAMSSKDVSVAFDVAISYLQEFSFRWAYNETSNIKKYLIQDITEATKEKYSYLFPTNANDWETMNGAEEEGAVEG